MSDQLRDKVEAWIAQDSDPEAQAELQALLEGGEARQRELAERFVGPLAFGTAGLRGVLGAGESTMNRAVIRRTTHGLGTYLLQRDDLPGAERMGVVVGYDGRRMSREFAEEAAGVLTALGIKVRLTTEVCPTPLVAFAVTRTQAAAGIMITASHNPPQYNGYKVYAENGAQIIPPMDLEIASAIAAAPGANEIAQRSLNEARQAGLLEDLGDDVERAYLDAVQGLARRPGAGDRGLKLVYTPLHGVGLKLTQRALEQAGFTDVHPVPEQAQPDGAFPTVNFPNPEEDGALDLALGLARERSADLVLAQDPDADRLAVVVRTAKGDYVQLTGNEVGVLLGHYLLTEGEGARGEGAEDRVVLASFVSSPQLGVVAQALGVHYEETLTGFKWIANRAMELERDQGRVFVFGYEEALGYSVGRVVRDKDGISAALLMAELAALRKAEGKTLIDELEAIARRYGLFASGQRSRTYPGSEGADRMAAIMDGLRRSPPERVGAHTVAYVCDYQANKRATRTGEGEAIELSLPKSNVLTFELAGGSRIIARPSGTEPKIKFYFDVRGEMREGERFPAAKARARADLEVLADAFVSIAER